MNQPGFLAAAALIATGTYGWGRILLAVLGKIGTPHADRSTLASSGPMVVALGLATVLTIAGFAVALGICRLAEIVGILGCGTVTACALGIRRVARTGVVMPQWRTLAVGASFAVVTFLAYGATLHGPINPNDDDPGYVYLAYRLLATGGLVDPFNLRRITSYGGGEFFEALFIRLCGSGAALGMEWFFGILLATALVVRRSNRPWAWLVALVLGVALTVVHPVGIWANSAPTFTGLALTLAIFQLLGDDDRSWRGDVTIGLLLGGLFALRFEFAIPVVVAVALVTLVRDRFGAWRAISTVAGTTLVAIAGWAIALERSSKTVLFPLFAGDYNESFPWQDPAFRTTAQFLSRLWGEVGTDAWGIEMVGVVTACLILFATSTNRPRTIVSSVITVALAGAVGCGVLIVSETHSLSGGVLADIGRYNAPSALALTLFVADALWTAATAMSGAGAPDDRAATRPWRLRATVCATMAVALVDIPIGAAFPTIAPFGSAIHAVSHATYNEGVFAVKRLDGRFGNGDRLSSFARTYAAINRAVPRGARLLTAVQYPGLLDFSRFNFATLDIAGAVSPPPGIPLTHGGVAVQKYLSTLGYNGIVASVTSAPGLDNYRSWVANTTSGIENYRAMASEFTAWAHDLSQLSRDHAVRRVRIGTLEYLSWTIPKGT